MITRASRHFHQVVRITAGTGHHLTGTGNHLTGTGSHLTGTGDYLAGTGRHFYEFVKMITRASDHFNEL